MSWFPPPLGILWDVIAGDEVASKLRQLRRVAIKRSWKLLNEGGILVMALSPLDGFLEHPASTRTVLTFMGVGLMLWLLGLILEWLA